MNRLFSMFLSFFKIGAFTFGGGYAMIPLIQTEVVDEKKWLSEEEFLDLVVVSQSFPGALAVNVSTFIGYRVSGFAGAVMALLGTVLPSFFIILAVASVFLQFRSNRYVDLTFKGIAGAVPMLVLVAVTSLGKSIKRNLINAFILVATIISIRFFKVNPVLIIIASGLFGYFYYREKV